MSIVAVAVEARLRGIDVERDRVARRRRERGEASRRHAAPGSGRSGGVAVRRGRAGDRGNRRRRRVLRRAAWTHSCAHAITVDESKRATTSDGATHNLLRAQDPSAGPRSVTLAAADGIVKPIDRRNRRSVKRRVESPRADTKRATACGGAGATVPAKLSRLFARRNDCESSGGRRSWSAWRCCDERPSVNAVVRDVIAIASASPAFSGRHRSADAPGPHFPRVGERSSAPAVPLSESRHGAASRPARSRAASSAGIAARRRRRRPRRGSGRACCGSRPRSPPEEQPASRCPNRSPRPAS